ncbi:type II toxin-antitoxin system PemK/MazF family toxin [Sediminispirochaeta bajacaliforniensis]|uniref:type II toxin-antitoxin system PemK/MazF family toxin n=1 Tax=Sediminispirochaeta bajacaliforniensis TaxID=148 RepID=UPI00039FFAC0|nr:type II toxin-antitoxin system PemK/MazF family toxin [Sediminispirochaeta bajacaliforniensis]
MADPQRGELWWINFDPTIGAEISKQRLAVVVSPDSVGKLPLRIVVPVTEWKDRYASYPWNAFTIRRAGFLLRNRKRLRLLCRFAWERFESFFDYRLP